jgi:hypothetical protein
MSKRKRFKGGGRRFIQLYTNVKRSQAYYSLSVYARAALFELLDKYNGVNNGMIGLGCRELAELLNCSKRGAANFLRELDDSGLAHPLTPGAWRGKKATEWRLTFYRCDKTGELPKLNWEPRSQCTRGDAKGHQGIHKPPLSARGEPQKPKSSMNESPFSAPRGTHIDIYQGVQDSGRDTDSPPWIEVTAEGKAYAESQKAWTKPTILSDEPRDFAEFPIEQGVAA